jgi:hypothetical protein
LLRGLRREYEQLFEKDVDISPVLRRETAHEPHGEEALGADFVDETESGIREYGLKQ